MKLVRISLAFILELAGLLYRSVVKVIQLGTVLFQGGTMPV